jgi:pimeloyl-ACP methyl ester carboxylesterase
VTAAVTTDIVKADGADLSCERRGDGPPLLMITGGGGDCGYYTAIAEILADSYTIVTYDRRGNSRSPLHGVKVKIEMHEQSADAVAVLAASGFETARIFGNSGGATIALDLAANHPQVIEAVVPHEPPVPRVLPRADAEECLAIYDEIDRVLASNGWQAAFALFQVKNGLMPADHPQAMAFLLDPARVLPPGPHLDVLMRLSHNWEYMMRHEVRSFIDYEPDLAEIAGNHLRIAFARGVDSKDGYSRRASAAAAKALGAELVDFPGTHMGPLEPRPFRDRVAKLARATLRPASDRPATAHLHLSPARGACRVPVNRR